MSQSFEKEFSCPYCGSSNEIRLDTGGGRKYALTTDCEICCRPILVDVRIVGDDCEIGARPENE